MRKTFIILTLLISIFYLSLPCEAIKIEEIPPGTKTRVSATSSFTSLAYGVEPYVINGLGARWRTAPWTCWCCTGPGTCGEIINIHKSRANLLCDFKPNNVIAPYISLNVSSTGTCNTLSAWSVLDYTYVIKPIRPDAPESVNILLIFEGWSDLSLGMNCNYDPDDYHCGWSVRTKVYEYNPQDYNGKPPYGDWKALKHLLQIKQEDDPPNSKKSEKFVFRGVALPNETRNVRLEASCGIGALYSWVSPIWNNCKFETDGCIVTIDPTITIDPNFTVNIGGEDYPANEVYKIEYSKDWFDLKPKAMPSIPLLLLDTEVFSLRSSSFSNGAPIPVQHSLQGGNLSPPLSWSNAPANTKSFVLIMDDPDAPGGTWDHWIVYNIPAGTTSLAENAGASGSGGLPSGAVHGTNSWGNNYYQGPSPPSGTHRYYIKLYALSVSQLNPSGTNKAAIEAAMQGKILKQTQLMGTYTYTP